MTTLVLQPAAAGIDAHIIDGTYASVNFGSATDAVIGTSTADKATLKFRYLTRFDLSGIPAGAVIFSATLSLFRVGDMISSPAQFHARRLIRPDWTELGVTWNKYDGANNWTAPGGDYASEGAVTITVASGSDLVFPSLAPLVSDALAERAGMLELIVLGPESGTASFVSVATSDHASAALRPRLVVEYGLRPQLAIADHADGSGATATISGADPAGVTTIYVRNFDGALGQGDWTIAGSIAGNGDVELTLPLGHYFAYATSSVGTTELPSPVAYFAVSDGIESIHSRCLAAVQARVRLLALEGLPGEQVVIEKVPSARNLATEVGLPAVIVSPRRSAMPAEEGTNRSDDVHYDVMVTIFDRDNQESTLEDNLDRHLFWREQVARAFRNQRLPGVGEIINTHIKPAEGLIPKAWQHQLMTSAVLLRFTSREPRGF